VFANINCTLFAHLLVYNTEFYKCNNYRHIARDYRSSIRKSPKQNREEDVLTKHREEYTRVGKRKQKELKKEECGLALYAKNKDNQWYIDSGCSKHIIGDQTKFLTLKEEKGGSFTFGDNAPERIVRKGIVRPANGKTKTQNVLYVEGLNNNILSVIQMCDQGYNLIHDILFDDYNMNCIKEHEQSICATYMTKAYTWRNNKKKQIAPYLIIEFVPNMHNVSRPTSQWRDLYNISAKLEKIYGNTSILVMHRNSLLGSKF
jgi:hypothetical protein